MEPRPSAAPAPEVGPETRPGAWMVVVEVGLVPRLPRTPWGGVLSRFRVLIRTLRPPKTPLPRILQSVTRLFQPITNHLTDHSHRNTNHHHLLYSVYIPVCLKHIFAKYCPYLVCAYRAVCLSDCYSVFDLARFSRLRFSLLFWLCCFGVCSFSGYDPCLFFLLRSRLCPCISSASFGC